MTPTERIRSAMPGTAANIDEFRSIFGEQCKVTWASENGIEIGRRGEEGVVPVVQIKDTEHATATYKRR